MAISEARRAYLRAYQLEWIKRRRDEWITRHGPCAKCGSTDRLEVDHIDHSTKAITPAGIWSLTAAKREAELAKCQVLCHACHKRKSAGEKAQGERNANARLTEDAVREIRASSEPGSVLAARFGIDKANICRVRRGETWRHVT